LQIESGITGDIKRGKGNRVKGKQGRGENDRGEYYTPTLFPF
jgi:hypothetical protein